MNENWVSTIDAMILTGENMRTRKESCFSAPLSPKIIKRTCLKSSGGSKFCGREVYANLATLVKKRIQNYE